jgi:hypothetical protein
MSEMVDTTQAIGDDDEAFTVAVPVTDTVHEAGGSAVAQVQPRRLHRGARRARPGRLRAVGEVAIARIPGPTPADRGRRPFVAP